jgi:cephalosporin hydroxylase
MITTIKEVLDHVEYLKTAPPYEINEHLATFQRLGAECDTIVEFGVGIGTSTWAWLSTQPKFMRSYDIIKYDQLDSIFETAQQMEWDWDLILTDTSDPTLVIPECDLLFIDSLHNAEHVQAELRQADRVKKYIVFHDIEKWGTYGESKERLGEMDQNIKGINYAINEFLDAHPEWQEVERYKNNNGLLVIKKVS